MKHLQKWLFVSSVLLAGTAVLAFTLDALILRHPIQVGGYLEPQSTVQLNFGEQAPITAIYVQPGDVVHVGEVLARQNAAPAQAKLLADEAVLAADQAQLIEVENPTTPAEAAQLKAEVALAQSDLSEAGVKVGGANTADGTSITALKNNLAAAEALHSADQQEADVLKNQCADIAPVGGVGAAGLSSTATATTLVSNPDVGTATSALSSQKHPTTTTSSTTTPSTSTTSTTSLPASTSTTAPINPVPYPTTPTSTIPASVTNTSLLALCLQSSHQLATDAAAIVQASGALQESTTNQQVDSEELNSALQVAQSELAVAEANQAVGTAAGTAATIAKAKAQVASDNATIATDQEAVAGDVITSTLNGVVAAVGGEVGDVASQDGVRYFETVQSLPKAQSSGINLFPQQPQTQTQTPAQFSSAVTVDSLQMKIVIEEGETTIRHIHIGQTANISLPAIPGSATHAVVTRIEPGAVNQSGSVSFLVDLEATSIGPSILAPNSDETAADVVTNPTNSTGYLEGLTVDVSF